MPINKSYMQNLQSRLLFGEVTFMSKVYSQLTGKERTLPQWKHLLASAGFELLQCHQTRGPMVIFEAQPSMGGSV